MKRDLDSMYFNASNEIFERARSLRSEMTSSELLLWEEVRNRKLGVKFRRQHPINQFIVDFYCHEKRLVLEVDGGIHSNPKIAQYDLNRTAELENFGLTIIRFSNEKINNDISFVIKRMKKILSEIPSQ